VTDAPAKRHVSIHLAPWAPDVDPFRLADDRRWIHHWSVTPARSLAALLDRLGRTPAEIRIKQTALQDVAIGAEVTGEGGVIEVKPLAFVYQGLTEAELKAARAELIRAGWRPTPPGWFDEASAPAPAVGAAA
jgi:hypothetical protein